MKASIVQARYEHLPALADRLREHDRLELYVSMGGSTLSSLITSFECSVVSWCLLVKEQPIMIWGVAPYDALLGDVGIPWMVGTDDIDTWQIYIARRASRYIGLMHVLYPRLLNYAHAGNIKALRFLEWCGFSISSCPLVIESEFFYEIRRSVCVE